MRLLHTSDWHLGRAFHRVNLLEAQAAFIGHLVATVREREVDAVVVSGDVYDRAVPPFRGDATQQQLGIELADLILGRDDKGNAHLLAFRAGGAPGLTRRSGSASIAAGHLAGRHAAPMAGF